jgi:cell division protein FtsW
MAIMTRKAQSAKTKSRAPKSKRKPRPRAEGSYDWGLITVVITLLTLGLIMVFSASYAQGLEGFNDPFYFISRQLMWTVLGLIALVGAMKIPYYFWERMSIPLMALALVSLMAVITFGNETFGSARFLRGGSIQPSEPAKIIIIIYIATWLASKGRRIRDVKVGLLPFSVLLGAVTVLIVTQPDISTALIIVITASIMFFIAGAELKQLLVVGAGTAATFGLVINYSTYARGRIERYFSSIRNPLESAEWQSVQSTQAIINGGPLGVGVGNSQAKYPGFLPVSWSDNIFAIIGEELGLVGALLVILLFAVLAYRGLRIALNAPDNFGMLLATGITALLILQAVLNTAVVVAVAPPTGVTLPFVSYGGSSLVTALGAIGIMLNVGKHIRPGAPSPAATGNLAYARFDFGWGNGRTRLSGHRRRRTTRTNKRKSSSTSRSSAGQRSSRRTARSSRR